MAHNGYIRPGGIWNLLSVLLSSEMATFDLRQYQSINGDLGGTWTPAAVLIIGGAQGLRVTGPFVALDADITITSGRFLTVNSGGTINAQAGSVSTFAGTWNLSGAGHVQSGGTLTVDNGGAVSVASGGATTWASGSTLTTNTGSTANINGAVNIKAGSNVAVKATATMAFEASSQLSAAVSSDVLLHGNNTLDGTQTIGGTTTIDDTVHVDAAVTWRAGSSLSAVATAPFSLANVVTCTNQLVVDTGGGFFLNGDATQDAASTYTRHGNMTLDGDDATTSPRFAYGPNVDATFDPSTKDFWEVPVLSGNTEYRLTNPAKPGVYRISQILNVDPVNTLTVKRDSDSATLKVFSATKETWIDVKWDGSTMSVAAFGQT